MVRDYKNIERKQLAPGQMTGMGRGFLIGLVFGMMFAGAVHVYHVLEKPACESLDSVVCESSTNDPSAPVSEKTVQPKPGLGSDLHDVLLKESDVLVPKSSIHYLLQAGNYRTLEEADARRSRILALGYKAKIREITVDKEVWYFVELGPYDQIEPAEAVVIRLKYHSIEALLKEYSE